MQFPPNNGDFTFVSSAEAEGRSMLAQPQEQQALNKPAFTTQMFMCSVLFSTQQLAHPLSSKCNKSKMIPRFKGDTVILNYYIVPMSRLWLPDVSCLFTNTSVTDKRPLRTLQKKNHCMPRLHVVYCSSYSIIE